jgi:PAS domain S-box-containing protein
MKNSLLFVIFILVTNMLLAGQAELTEKEYLDNNPGTYAVQNVIDYTLLWQISILFFIFFLIGLFFMLLLKRNNKRLTELLNSTMEGVVITRNGIVKTANQPAFDLFGYENIDALQQINIRDFVAEDSQELLQNKLKENTAPYEALMKRKDGSTFPALVQGVNFKDGTTRISTVLDLTKLKQAEQQNLYLSERIKLAFDGSRDGLWDWNLLDNSLYLSSRWKEMLGYKDDELENTFDTWQSRVHPDDLEEALKNIELCINDKDKVFENKHRLRHKDGHWVWIYDRGKVQFDIDGKAIRMIGTHTDLTTEINLSNELSQLNETLELRVKEQVEELERQHVFMAQRSRLTEMGEMLSSIAHQWRQPLNRINSNVAALRSVLRRDPVDHETLVSQTEMIEENTQYMSDTIEDFSNFFHPDKTETEFMVQDIIDKALNLLDQRTKNIKINIVTDKEVKVFSFEKEYLHVLLIILNNAVDNFESKAIDDPKIDIIIQEKENILKLTVCDNGEGIEDKKIDQIFDPYFSTKFSHEGTGLGLYMAKMMIENSMHGQLHVENKNAGACFEMIIPSRKEYV